MATTDLTWRPIGVTDLLTKGSEKGTCDWCGRRDLRFVHTVEDQDGDTIEVGSECCRQLCFGYDPSREEQKLRALWDRKNRWLTKRWRRAASGNDWIQIESRTPAGKILKARLVVGQGEFSWWYVIFARNERVGRGSGYPSAEAAKRAAIDDWAELAGW